MAGYELGYREVIPDQTLPEKWRELTLNTGGTQSTLQDIKVPERAGGYWYLDTCNPFTRNRFIYWRICHDVLELVENSLDIDLTGNHLRFRFQDTPILEGITVQELYKHVMVLVPTVSSVHRLVFPHPEEMSRNLTGRHPQPSIFMEARLNCVEQQFIINHTTPNAPLPHTAATYLSMNQEAVFALSYSTGATLLVRMDYHSGIVSTQELKQTSLIDRFLSGLVTGQILKARNTEEEVPTSMVLHTLGLDTYLFTIGQDCRLRMWSCDRSECIMVVDVLETTTESRQHNIQGHQNHLIRKATGNDENDLLLGTFFSFADKCIFIVLRPYIEQGNYAVQRLYTCYDQQGDLVDFWMSSQKLWGLWSDSSGDTVVTFRVMDRLSAPGRLTWEKVKLESPPARTFDPSEQGSMDPRQAYLSYLFHPGVFPLSVINRALTIYRRNATGAAPALLPDVAASVLRERVSMAVDSEIESEIQDNNITGEEYLDISWRCWSRFYSCCVQYYWAGTRPLAFLASTSCHKNPGPMHGCPLGIVRKSQFSLLRPIDEVEHLFEIGITLCDQTPLPPVICDVSIMDPGMIALMKCLLEIEKSLKVETKDAIALGINNLKEPQTVISDFFNSHTEVEYLLSPTISVNIGRSMSERVLMEACVTLLQVINLDSSPAMTMDLDAEDVPPQELANISYVFSSQMGINIVSETMHQICNTRFCILRNLLILLQIVRLQFDLYFENNAEVFERMVCHLIPQASTLMQGYNVLSWISQVPCSQVTPTMLEASLQQLAVIGLVERNAMASGEYARLAQKGSRTLTLLTLFLTSSSAQYAHNLMAQRNPDEEAISQWHTSLLPHTYTIGKLVWPLSSLFVFPEFLLTSCQYLLVQEYVRLLSHRIDCNQFTRMFLRGFVLLDTGEAKKACDYLLDAEPGVHVEEFLMSRLGLENVDITELSKPHRNLLYYLKLMKLFEQIGESDCVLRVANVAISNCDPNDPDLAMLYSMQFSHFLRLRRHKKAHDAMLRNPDKSRRRDTLRQLLNSMIETGDFRLLSEIHYGQSLIVEVEEFLLARARSQDLLKSHYYTILHSLLVSKNNIRKAAIIMYEQAFRLNQEVISKVSLQRQANCLLACASELSAVSPEYQWVLKPKLAGFGNATSPKRNVDGDELYRGQIKRQVEIVTLEEIRKEYQVVKAKVDLVRYSKSDSIMSEVARLEPHQLISVLATAGRFDQALRIAGLYDLSKSTVFEILTTSCVYVTTEEKLPAESIDWIAFNNIRDVGQVDAEASKVAWKYLQSCLERHEQKGQTSLHRSVVNKLIHLKAFLPQWLVDSYKKSNIGEMLRLLLDSGRLEEAARLSCDLYRAAMGHGNEDFNISGLQLKSFSICLPHNALEWCLLELQAAATQPGIDDFYAELYTAMKALKLEYFAKAKEVSNDIRTNPSQWDIHMADQSLVH